jgi:WD40 repeat protein
VDQDTALCVLTDGRLASGSEDNTIRLWDVARSAEIARLHCAHCPTVASPRAGIGGRFGC